MKMMMDIVLRTEYGDRRDEPRTCSLRDPPSPRVSIFTLGIELSALLKSEFVEPCIFKESIS